MTNEEKHKTPEERNEAFSRFCRGANGCSTCPLGSTLPTRCHFSWLALEAEEKKPLPCPFCGGEAEVVTPSISQVAYVRCKECRVLSMLCNTKAEAIAAWNRRTK